MKFFIQVILVFIITAIAEFFFPWWTLIVVCFFVAFFIYSTRALSFLGGFLGVGLLWFSYSLFINIITDSILTNKIAQIFKLPDSFLSFSSSVLLVIITAIIGGVTGGFSSLAGHLFREFFTRKEYKD